MFRSAGRRLHCAFPSPDQPDRRQGFPRNSRLDAGQSLQFSFLSFILFTYLLQYGSRNTFFFLVLTLLCSHEEFVLFVLWCFHKGGDGTAHFQVQAHVAMMDKNFKLAEMHYVEQVGNTHALFITFFFIWSFIEN